MKTILFYSEDFNLCLSLLVYLQNKFNVITTTNFDNIDKIAKVQTNTNDKPIKEVKIIKAEIL